MRKTLIAVIAAAGIWAQNAQAETKLILWHSMPGALGQWIEDLAQGFNETTAEYRVVPVYNGPYDKSMRAALAAPKGPDAPHMVQIYEVGAADMNAARGLIKPLHQVMAQAGIDFNDSAYLPAVTLYYSSLDGKLPALPLNSSTPVLVYDRKAFARAGLDASKPPATWPEVETAARALKKAGAQCGITTQWQSWILLENMSAWHDVPFATKQNGIGGIDAHLKFNSPFHVRHIEALADWARQGLFRPHGNRDEALAKFLDGTCPMMLATSAVYSELKAARGLEFGMGMLPYWPDVEWAPRNSIIGGAALWVMNGRPQADYLGVAAFFEYLSSPEIQAQSHQRTGYMPITRAAYSLSRRQGFYETDPNAETALKQITLHWPTENSRGVRLGNFVAIREVINRHLNAIWAGKETAKDGLDQAVAEGDALIQDFVHAVNQRDSETNPRR